MFAQIRALLQAVPGEVGCVIHCPATGAYFAHNAQLPLVAASVIKLPIMAEAFRQREAGTLDFQERVIVRRQDHLPSCGALSYMHDGLEVTVEDLVTLMIILSDNTATNLLIERLGMAAINRAIAQLGLTGTQLRRKLFQAELSAQGIENTTTAQDMARLLAGLMAGKVVSPEASQEMLALLGKQRLNGKIPFFLHARGVPVAHKTGEDEGITHDVGILYARPPVILCFLSNRTVVPQAERALQDIAALLA